MPALPRRLPHLFSTSVIAAAFHLIPAAAQAGLPREFTVHRPATAFFFTDYDENSSPNRIWTLGAPGDVGLLADVDGDTLADTILYRNGHWFVDFRNDFTIDLSFILGGASDIPVVGDFLGDGRAGFGVFRPSNGLWYLDRNRDLTVDFISPWGASGDLPVVADFDGDGRADRAVYRSGTWLVDVDLNSTLDAVYYLGGVGGDIPVAGDFNGDWRADIAIFRSGGWYIDHDNNGTVDRIFFYGASGDRPLYSPLNPASSVFVRAGAAGGNGSQAAPFGTIAAALSVAGSGSIIRLAAGDYNEGVCFSTRQNLTFVGAGVLATHLRGANNNGCNNSLDGFVAVSSQNIVVRNLHVNNNVAGCALPVSQCNRGIVAFGTAAGPTSMTLDRVSTRGNRSHGVLAAGLSANPTTLLVQYSNLNRSRLGNGLRLGGGVSATVQGSTIDENGTTLPVAADAGRGVESFGDSSLLIEHSSSSFNYHSALLFTGTSAGIVRYNRLDGNGHGAVFFEQATSGQVYGNVMAGNGTLGTPGPTTGFNTVEVFTNWTGPQMLIYQNTISGSTTGGIFIGSGTATVNNNYLYDNFLGITLFTQANPTTATVQGNTFELPLEQGNEEGLFIERWGAALNATVGGTGAQRNTFINYIGNPAIHCSTGTEAAVCPSGGNVFTNSNIPVNGCPASCVP